MTERPSTKHNIQIDDENINRPNYAVITNIYVTGSAGMVYTGVDRGTGLVTIFVSGSNASPTSPATDQIGIFGISGTTSLGTGTSISVGNYLGFSITGSTLYLAGSIGTDVNRLATGDRGVTNGDFHNHTGGFGGDITAAMATAITLAPSKNPPVGSDSFLIQSGERVTLTNTRTFFKTTYDSLYSPIGGWISEPNTWTCFTIDSPIFNVFINANVTGTIGVGDRIQATQAGANKLFLVHGVSITGSNTYLNLYGGTDYALVSGSLTSPQYSQLKAPFGFPLSPSKWSVTATDAIDRSQSSPSGTVWYNLGSFGITAPIGMWDLSYIVVSYGDRTVAGNINVFTTLSTSSTSESNTTFTRNWFIASNTGQTQPLHIDHQFLSILTKTNYFLNLKTSIVGLLSIQTFGASSGASTIVLTSVYL